MNDGMNLNGKKIGKIVWWILFALLILCTVGLQIAARTFAGFADWYNVHIYARLVETEGLFFGRVSFSAGELLVLLVTLWFLELLGRQTWKLIRDRRNWKGCVIRVMKSVGMTVAAALFLYTAQCGVNYFVRPFSAIAGYEIRKSTPEELEGLCRALTDEINEAAEQLDWGDEGIYRKPVNLRELTKKAMEHLGEEYDCLAGTYPRPKPIASSVLFSYQYITGMYSPFTIEANYNKDIPDSEQAAVMCHELSHLKSFMREDEANFIAYLACRESGNPELQYSGAMLAYTYCMNALYTESGAELYREIYRELLPQVITDRQRSNEWWKQYDTPVKEVSDKVNNTYLQANAQSDGTKSYGRMVDLLLAEYRSAQKAE